MGAVVGIDLGTTYSAVAWINPNTKIPEIIRNQSDMPITPSVIWFKEDGSHVCGEDAKEALDNDQYGCASAFKRFMGKDTICCSAYGKQYTARELSALLLAHLKREAELALKQEITDAVITVPAYFFNDERDDTLYAANKAGLNVLQLINEPTAAALNYGLKHWRENAIIMVYDLGGGTFDVTLIGMNANYEMESISTVGDHILGGKDWDDCLAELIFDKIYDITRQNISEDQETQNRIYSQVEEWKKKLSRYPSIDCDIDVVNYGVVTVNVTRSEFDKATRPQLDKTAALCNSVLNKKALKWENVTDVLLVGGSTRMPQVSEFLEKLIHKKPLMHVNPDEAVALGAAMQTAMPREDYVVYVAKTKPAEPQQKSLFGIKRHPKQAPEQPESKDTSIAVKYSKPVQQSQALADIAIIKKRDVQAHGMGIIAVNVEGTAYINENIIPPNMSIPVKSARSFKYTTRQNGENELNIFVVEGEGDLRECRVNAKYVVSGITHEKGGTIIRVQYSFDRNSIIHVQVRQGDSTCDLPIRKAPIDDEELQKFYLPIEAGAFGANLSVVLALDVSYSMEGKPLRDAKDAMISFVQKYEDSGANIGVIAVSDRVAWVQKPTDDYRKCIGAINGIVVGLTGVANGAQPFDYIYNELKDADGDKFAVVLTDGRWDCITEAVAAAKKCNSAGIETAAIGFSGAKKEFLDDISSRDDMSIMTSQAELTRSFENIAQSIGGGAKKGQKGAESATDTWETNDQGGYVVSR